MKLIVKFNLYQRNNSLLTIGIIMKDHKNSVVKKSSEKNFSKNIVGDGRGLIIPVGKSKTGRSRANKTT